MVVSYQLTPPHPFPNFQKNPICIFLHGQKPYQNNYKRIDLSFPKTDKMMCNYH